jgi:hypothetical protein
MSEFELRQRLRALRVDQEPARDLWPAIAARLGAPQAGMDAPNDESGTPSLTTPRRRLAAWPEALAAVLVVALGAGALLLREAPVPAVSAQAMVTPWTLREAQAIDLSYQAALGTTDARGLEGRPQELVAAATELDAAQRSIERALHENPGSTHLLKLLQQTHEQRLRLYRREQLVG